MSASPFALLIESRVGPTFEFGGYQVSRATSEDECREAYRLRFDTFREEGFIDPSFFPNGELRDEFDSCSTQILVRDPGGDLISTTRFVHHSKRGFPTEALFDFDPPGVERARLGEYGRLAIKEGHRGGSRAPMLGMLKAVFECMVESGATHVFAFLSPGLARSYAALGCVSKPLILRPPSVATRAARKPMSGYFASQAVLPVLFDLREMMDQVGVPVSRAGALLSLTAESPRGPKIPAGQRVSAAHARGAARAVAK